jgi:hypothetical protein
MGASHERICQQEREKTFLSSGRTQRLHCRTDEKSQVEREDHGSTEAARQTLRRGESPCPQSYQGQDGGCVVRQIRQKEFPRCRFDGEAQIFYTPESREREAARCGQEQNFQ